MQSVLDRLNVPWIELGISPIRFLADFAVTFRTSQHFKGRFPEKFRLSFLELAEGVERVRKFYDYQQRTNLSGSIIFFAQTELDRTLIKRGRIAGPEDAVAGLNSVQAGRKVFVKPHPFAPDNPVVTAIRENFSGEILGINTYEILSSEDDIIISTICLPSGWKLRSLAKRRPFFTMRAKLLERARSPLSGSQSLPSCGKVCLAH